MDRRNFIKGTSASTAAILSLSGISGFSAHTHPKDLDWTALLDSFEVSKNKTLRLLYPQGCLANLKPIITVFEQLTGVKVEAIQAGFDSISSTMLKNC